MIWFAITAVVVGVDIGYSLVFDSGYLLMTLL